MTTRRFGGPTALLLLAPAEGWVALQAPLLPFWPPRTLQAPLGPLGPPAVKAVAAVGGQTDGQTDTQKPSLFI